MNKPENITITLTSEEAETLGRLLDAAVRSQGLAAAGPALRLVAKIQEAGNAALSVVEPPEDKKKEKAS